MTGLSNPCVSVTPYGAVGFHGSVASVLQGLQELSFPGCLFMILLVLLRSMDICRHNPSDNMYYIYLIMHSWIALVSHIK